MTEQRLRRRLTVIQASDIVGYSRLMEADEAGTLTRLRTLRKELFDPGLAKYGGRLVKTAGDGALAEFASVVDAVEHAIDIQSALARLNADVAADRRIMLRIGINIGDVVVEDGDIYGDGVNVAARLEGLAEPGGVCISGVAYDNVAGKIEAQFEDLGPQTVKNIARPIRVVRVVPKASESPVLDVSAPVPGFQGRPAIAVLPFENLSGDPDQEYFVDGMTEDILTRLATWRWCPVIARNSSFAYKGKAVDIRRVGKELGARYVLEGTIRKLGRRVRVTAQLIDADTGHHVWAERYDRGLDDIFDLQDEITETIVAAMEPVVDKAETRRAHTKRPESLDAWDTAMRANWHFNRTTRDDMEEALRLYRASLALDPNLSVAWGYMAFAYYIQMLQGWSPDPAESVRGFVQAAQTAISLDDREPLANAVAGWGRVMARDHDAALEILERAIELNPSFVIGHICLGAALALSGRPQEGVERLQLAIRLSPNDPFLHQWFGTLSMAYYQAKEYEKALESARKSLQRSETYPYAHRALCSALAMLGRLDEAKAALARFLELSPGYFLESARASRPFRNERDEAHYFEGLRRAGWTG